jgi:hypothetical protein
MKRILLTLAALGDRLLRTHLDRPLCQWTEATNDE